MSKNSPESISVPALLGWTLGGLALLLLLDKLDLSKITLPEFLPSKVENAGDSAPGVKSSESRSFFEGQTITSHHIEDKCLEDQYLADVRYPCVVFKNADGRKFYLAKYYLDHPDNLPFQLTQSGVEITLSKIEKSGDRYTITIGSVKQL